MSSRLKTLDSGLRRNDKAEILEVPYIDLDNKSSATPSRGVNVSISQQFSNFPGIFNLSFWYAAKFVNTTVDSNRILFTIGDALPGSVLDSVNSNVAWTQYTGQFTSGTAPVTLTFSGGGTADRRGGYLDNVIVTAVPEPSTYMMLLAGLGLMGTIAFRRRGRRLD